MNSPPFYKNHVSYDGYNNSCEYKHRLEKTKKKYLSK